MKATGVDVAGGRKRPGGRGADPQAIFEKALAALEGGDLKRAARDARKLSKAAPQVPDSWLLRATIAQQMGAHDDAAKHLHRALTLQPDDPGALNNLGNALRQSGDTEKAEAAYRKSLDLRPGHTDTMINLGNILHDQDKFAEAEAAFGEVLALEPPNVDARLNMAAAIFRQRRFADAQELYADLVSEHDRDPRALAGLYQSLAASGRMDEAVAVMSDLLEMAGDDAKVQTEASVLKFATGDWRGGWQGYAHRLAAGIVKPRPFDLPWWSGGDPAGQRILVWGEQGLGDELMYASMVPDLAAAGGQISLECDPRLLPLLRRSFPQVDCVGRSDPPGKDIGVRDMDYQIASVDLGQHFRPDEESFRGGQPFLLADQTRAEDFRRKYGGDGAFLVGITWRSIHPDVGDVKSMALEALLPVLSVRGARFVDLQYGDTAADLAALEEEHGIPVLHDGEVDPMIDIDGHAAQIAAMDLVITISNTTAHMAGGLGIPTWVLLQNVPGRRWLLERQDSPWYGSVRLFRQSRPDDWTGPVAEAAAALAERVAGA